VNLLLPLAALTDTQWTVFGGGFGALLVAVTTISVALINRSTGRQNNKDTSSVLTVAELTEALSSERLKTSALSSEITTLKNELRWLRKQLEK
jgi:hypothetical protein